MRRLALVFIAFLALTSSAFATADGPDAWRVTGVASWDVLNVRVGPGTNYFIIDALPHNARAIQIGTCTPTVTREQFFALTAAAQAHLNTYSAWCVVTWNGAQRGWVSRRYLTEDAP